MEERLTIPERFNKNALAVRAMGTPADTGTWLIAYMCQRLEVPDLGGLDVLDFGCGCRFPDAIVNNELPVGSYAGIDVDREMIEWLATNVTDERFRFYYWNAANPNYNPDGFTLTAETPLPTGEQRFDVICMFSVITHQVPQDAEAIFRILRERIKPDGRMFFSVNLQQMDDDYRELEPTPAAHSAYRQGYLQQLLERSGWQVLTVEPKNPQDLPIQDSVLCAPT